MRRFVLLALAVLFVLRYDFWWWNDPGMVFGLPIGLAYHIAFCFAVTAVMALVVRHAWPHEVVDTDDSDLDMGGGERQ